MKTSSRGALVAFALVAASMLAASPAQAVSIGLTDTFGTDLNNWFAGGLGVGAVPPVPPARIATGGPGGVGDAFMQVTSVGGCSGGPSPGCKLVVLNGAQWAGDYLTTGVNRIEMDLRNLGSTDLTIRLLFEDPHFAPPADEAVTTFGAFLPVGGGWKHVGFDIAPGNLTNLLGSNTAVMGDVTILRIIDSPTPSDPVSIVGQLGVDNIQARAVPEPASILLAATGLAGLAVRRLRRRR